MKKFTLLLSIVCFTFLASAQMPEAINIEPEGATAFEEFTLTLDASKSCPQDALFHADSVMMHSGVNIDGTAWQNVVDFDALGANGQQPKLVRIGPGFPAAITLSPGYVTAWDEVTITLDAKKSCPVGDLFDADSVMMHSGMNVNGQAWQNVVEFNGEGANGQKPKFTDNGDSTWSFTFVPADFYGVAEDDTVTEINCVFNAGDWSLGEGKDFDADSNCVDFTIPIGQPDAFKWAITYKPSDFYGFDESVTVTEINCVFNAGAWEAGEGKDYDADSNCVDFVVPLSQTGIHEAILNAFKLYPNPVGDELHISNLDGVEEIEIYTITGTVVKSFDNITTETFTINTSDLRSGVYFLSVRNKNAVLTNRFVKK